MSGFIDLHVHILPGIDDGAQRWEGSLEMRMCTALSRTAKSRGDLAPYTLNQNGRYLLGLHGRRARKAAFALLKEKRVHAVASDAHSAGRAMDLRQAEGVARTLCGDAYTRAVFNENPFRMCMGEPLPGCT